MINKKKLIFFSNLKYILIVISIFFIIIDFFFYKKIKVCICTIGKNENKYVKEFVEYYKRYRVDKIFLYDNNEINGEKFDVVLNKYIKYGFVKIIDFRGILKAQIKYYQDCYKQNYKQYDWLIFFDVDEYIFLKNYQNIKNFLKNDRFDKCQRIQLNWIFHTDNNLLYYDNRPLSKRFPEREPKARGHKGDKGHKKGESSGIKSILKGNIDINITDVHILSRNLTSCDGFGNRKDIQNIVTNTSDFEYYYIDHYYCKSTEEFINKLTRGSVYFGFDKEHMLRRINVYLSYNKITEDKLKLIENATKFNLSYYRNKIKKYSL